MPPWPGMLCPKSLMSKARLKPDAKKPPKGATRDAKVAITRAWNWKGAQGIAGKVVPIFTSAAILGGGFLRDRATNQRKQHLLHRGRNLVNPPDKSRVGDAFHIGPCMNAQVSCRADHVVEFHKQSRPLDNDDIE